MVRWVGCLCGDGGWDKRGQVKAAFSGGCKKELGPRVGCPPQMLPKRCPSGGRGNPGARGRPRKVVGATGFEPATSWSQTRRSTRLSYTPERSGQGGFQGVSRRDVRKCAMCLPAMGIQSLLASLTSLYMDTISRENNSMLPVAGVVVGAVALIIGLYAAVTVSKLKVTVAGQQDKVARIDDIASQVNSAQAASDKAARDIQSLSSSTQSAVT